MNYSNKLEDGVYWVGVNDRETDLFENIWPIPNGISYNSYLIVDEKVVLIDTVKIDYQDSYIESIKDLTKGRPIDYLVINHMEPDHSGSIKTLLKHFPDMKIIGNTKTSQFLKGFYSIEDNILNIENNETLEIGEKTLQFVITPMVHWPETMMTYLKEDKILFSGDVFGSFGAINGSIFDDQIIKENYEDEIIRYYSNIVGKYSPIANKHINSLSDIDINIVASTHGPVWRKDPEYIINMYKSMSNFEAREGAVVVYGTMYGNTKKIAESAAAGLADSGIKNVKLYDGSRTHESYLISDIWKYKGAIVASCSYNNGLFPPVLSLIEDLENRGIQKRYFGFIGTYSWSGGSLERMKEFGDECNINVLEPIINNQYAPTEENLMKAYQLGKNVGEKIKKGDS
ncbi:MAG: FprA family A-type flavoprotein [Halanaerobiales bacterium]|nr:FprA family A-type flavoprotein [Halanaerobiales bacterium]